MQIDYDLSQIAHIGDVFRRAGKLAPTVIRRAVKHTGDKAVTQMRNALVPQTGLKRKTIVRAVKGASAGSGYVIKSHGGNIRLKFFGARETRKGVSAAPWSRRHVYAGTFIKGGRFPNRVTLKMGGEVLQRKGRRRKPLTKRKSDLYIAAEMVKGPSETAFYATIQSDLPPRLEHELARILGG